jgi:hypothetical protein
VDTGKGQRIVLRVRNSGPPIGERGELLTGRPRLVLGLQSRFGCTVDGVPLRRHVEALSGDQLPDFVRYVLQDPGRRDPVLLLTPLAAGEYVTSPSRLLDEFLTLGSLYAVREPNDTFELTRELGRRELSCFHGGLRAYLPGFRLADDPFKHPLLLARPAGSLDQRHRLAQFLAARTVSRHEEDPEIAQLRDQRAVAYETSRTRTLSGLREQVSTARESSEWEAIADSYARENDALRADAVSLNERLLEANDRIDQLNRTLELLRQGHDEPDFQSLERMQPESVREAVELAGSLFEADLLFLATAFDSARESPYGRPQDVLEALRVTAEIARAKRSGPLGTRLDVAFRERGVDYRSGLSKNTSRKLRRQYVFPDAAGRGFACEEHLCFGGATHDPAECARIYLCTDTEDGRFVIGHVGRHLKIMSTR